MNEEKIDVKIVSKEEAEWTKIQDNQEDTIRNSNINIAVATEVLKLSENMLKSMEAEKKE